MAERSNNTKPPQWESALASSECLKPGAEVRSINLDHQQRASVHVQLVLVMYTPSFRPFVSEIVIRWSAGHRRQAVYANKKTAGSTVGPFVDSCRVDALDFALAV